MKAPSSIASAIRAGLISTAILCFAALAPAVSAAPSDLDPSFGYGGVHATAPECCGQSQAFAAAVQSDGKVLIAGTSSAGTGLFDAFVARLDASGTPDATFGPGGIRRLSLEAGKHASASAVYAMFDGRVVIAGNSYSSAATSRGFVARFLADGTPDTTFGPGGVRLLPTYAGETASIVRAVSVTPDDAVVIAGALQASNGLRDMFAARFLANGNVDTAFGTNGAKTSGIAATDEAFGMTIAGDGFIYVAGAADGFPAAMRLQPNGIGDPNFGSNGVKAVVVGAPGSANSVTFAPGGKMLLGGRVNSSAAFIQLTIAGDLDPTFDGDGIALLGNGTIVSIAAGSDGFFYGQIEPTTYSLTVRRVNAAGATDAWVFGEFWTGGAGTPPLDVLPGRQGGLAWSEAGVILGARGGGSESAAARLTRATGAFDPTFSGDGLAIVAAGLQLPEEPYTNAVVDATGAILLARGCFGGPAARCVVLTRLLSNGMPDAQSPRRVENTIAPAGYGGTLEHFVGAPGGKLYLDWSGGNGPSYARLLYRINADGTGDPSFTLAQVSRHSNNPRDLATWPWGTIAQYPDGRVLFGSARELRRFLADGTLDSAFNLGSPLPPATDAVVLADGSFLMATDGHALQKRGADGLLDTTFGSNGTQPINVQSLTLIDRIHVLPDGKILVAGRAEPVMPIFVTLAFHQSFRPYLMRLLPNGATDTSFGTNGVVRIERTTRRVGLAIRTTGGILLSGNDFVAGFTADGAPDAGFAAMGLKVVDPTPAFDMIANVVVHPDGGILLPGRVSGSFPTADGVRGGPALFKLIGDSVARSISAPPVGGVGVQYSTTLSTGGGTGPYTYAIESGSLPPGLTLSGATVSGTPTTAGSYPVTVTSTDASGATHAQVLTFVIHSAASLVTSYYRTILNREPDAAGQSYWQGEVSRLGANGANVSEVFYAMAAAFFGSTEYAARNPSDTQFLTDLYLTFFGRQPDSGGLAFWSSELSQGKPRGAVLNDFMFSSEFAAYMASVFGAAATSRPEVSMVMDFYRGLLSRLPEAQGLSFWLGRFRTAQCNGTVSVEAATISAQFIGSGEYAARQQAVPAEQRTAAYVVDLYNAFLKRGGDRAGFNHWVAQIESGLRTREQVRQAFVDSPEFQARVQAVIAAGCVM